MRNNYKYILSAFVLIFFISSSSLFSQTYSKESQNRTWSSNTEINTVFFKSSSDLTITPNLKMLRFTDGTNKYGWSSNGSANDIPAGWTYEILTATNLVPTLTTVSNDKKTITFTGSPDAELDIYLKVMDSSGNTIAGLSQIQLRFYVRGNFTVSTSTWNSCEQAYLINVNEVTVNNTFPCRPYRLVLYTEENESSTVVYDSNSDSNHDANSNSFKLTGLSTGNYFAVITNSCGERVNGTNGFVAVPITDSYTFGASVVFAGFECFEDSLGSATIKIEGAAIPITWTLKNSSSGVSVVSSSETNLYSSINYDPDFSTQNYTVTIPNLAVEDYTFTFEDGNGCDDEISVSVKKPEEIESDLITSESKTALACYGDNDGKLTFTASGGWTEPWTGNTINSNGWGNPYVFKLTKGVAEYSSGEVISSVDGSGAQNGYKTSFTGLSAGTYTLTVTENIATNPYNSNTVYKCSKVFTETFTITEPAELVATGTISNNNGFGISCNGADDGSINLSVSGGTTDYSYAWTKTGDASYSATTEDLSNLSSGTYNVTVTDANNCTDTASFTITEPVELTIADAGLSTAINCFDGNGQIKVNITGDSNGDGPSQNYTYTLSGTNYSGANVNESVTTTALTYTFTPKAGVYTVKVSDANSCEKTTNQITLTQPSAALAIAESITNITCNGDDDGEIDVTISGGTTDYSYAWTGPNSFSSTSADLTNLKPGAYSLTVTDANNCTITESFTITEPAELVATGTISNNNGFGISCNGADDGSINLSVSGGTTDYSYAWTKTGDASYSATTEDLSNLSSGTYNVTVTDANNCTDTASFTITEPVELTIADAGLSTAINCFDGNGQIKVNITGDSNGDGPSQNYTYTLSGTNYSGANVNESVTTTALTYTFTPKAGVYTVKVSDANSCEKTTNQITLTQPSAALAIAESITNITCNGQDNGAIDLTISGGTTNYSFSWTKTGDASYSASSEDLNSLSPGTYNVTVTDAKNCTISKSFTITEPAELVATGTISNNNGFGISCNGADDGSINLSVSGGTTGYTYSWSSPDGGSGLSVNSKDQSGLGPGTFNVTVNDANNCSDTASFTITEPAQLTISNLISDTNGFEISCFGANDGTIDITPSGGSGNYTYSWSTQNGTQPVNGQQDQSGLGPGVYTLTLADSNSCSISQTFTLAQPDDISVSAVISNYNGFEISTAGASNGSINITTVGGFLSTGATYTYSWSTSNGSGLDASSEDQSGLGAGTYTVVVTDSNNCTETKVYKLDEPNQLSFSSIISNFSGFEISCFGADDGSISITPSGGSGTYSYDWSTNNGSGLTQGQQNQTGLGPGTYSLIITDSNGNTISQNFVIDEPTVLNLSSTISDYNNFEVSCFGGADGEIDITVGGGTGQYTYNWSASNNGAGIVNGQQDQTGLSAGTYTVIIVDENNCEISRSFTLNSPDQISIISSKSDYNGFNVSCKESTDGTIGLTVSGGYLATGSSYTYSWSTNNGSGLSPTNKNQSGLSVGTYTVVAKDDNGCTITQDIEIIEPNILSISEIISNYNGFQISEAGENDGSINVSIVGGTSTYTYVWSTLDGSGLSVNSEDQNFLTAGTYSVIVTDTNGCVITKEYTLTEPKELLISLDNDAYKNDVFCYGDSTASIKVDITQGSIAPYTYSISGTTYLNENYSQTYENISNLTYTFTNLTAGSYSITINDANGASKTLSKEIRGPNNPLGLEGLTTDITCNGAADGIIDITVTGGGGSSNQFTYFYSWTTLDGSGLDSTAEDQTGLGPGTYTVVAKDINDCEITKSFTITQSPPLTYNLDSTKNITCNGDNDGEINITVTGGTGNYTHEWSSENGSGIQQGDQDQSGLGPGNYKLILRDGCNTFEYIYAITTPDPLEISLDEKVNVLCHDDSSGKIDISLTGGTLPYNYVWKDDFGNVYDRNVGNVFKDGDLSNIPAGLYDLTVTDANNCIATYSTEITQSEDLVIQIDKTDLNCYDSNDGTIKVIPSGGVAPYTYAWNDFGNGDFRQNLSAGTYQVTITDSNGCIEIRDIEILNAPLFDVNPIVKPVSCFGANDGSIELNFVGGIAPISFNWTDDSSAGQVRNNLSPGLYSVLITDGSGCEIQEDFVIIEPKEISIAGVITDAIDCDNPESGSIDLQVSGGNLPYTFLWSNGATTEDVSNLLANNYSVKITDSKGCTAEKEFSINRQEDLEISLQSDFFAICETKEVYQKNIVTVLGGVAPYTIEWSNGLVSGTNNEIMDTKIEGSYQVTVTDFLGCSESLVFDVTTPVIGSPEFEYDSFYLQTYGALSVNDPITFTNLSTEEYTNVSWDFGDGNNSNEENPVHTYSRRGEYDVTLTVEFILGCSYSITKTIYVGDPYEIVIPNAFTPNNDNFNDVFRPIYYGFKSINIGIYDTWGTLIYSEETTANEMTGWSGRIKGMEAENGNYFYQVTGTTHTDEEFSKNGSFTLIK
ncbi:gliding motility-associated C-terminal domain-containing protein [Flavobacteriaceae bacterium]|nr:gliding motility-associated C-terminal domain-containing protein [Flavobacteriaceae bacterium]